MLPYPLVVFPNNIRKKGQGNFAFDVTSFIILFFSSNSVCVRFVMQRSLTFDLCLSLMTTTVENKNCFFFFLSSTSFLADAVRVTAITGWRGGREFKVQSFGNSIIFFFFFKQGEVGRRRRKSWWQLSEFFFFYMAW